jgi:hypothetical protein
MAKPRASSPKRLAKGAIRMSEEIGTEAEGLLERACQLGLEGIIAKRREALDRSGRARTGSRSDPYSQRAWASLATRPHLRPLVALAGSIWQFVKAMSLYMSVASARALTIDRGWS